jgi:hypothetical protein
MPKDCKGKHAQSIMFVVDDERDHPVAPGEERR